MEGGFEQKTPAAVNGVGTMNDVEVCEDVVAACGEVFVEPLVENGNRDGTYSCKQYNGIQLVLDNDKPYTVTGMHQKRTFYKHLDTMPEGRRCFQCEICSRSFSDPSNLRRHKNIHTGQRPYGCEICDSTFRQKSQLDRHLFVHTGERPFQCAFCPKGFRDSTELKVHYRKHTGERPYRCELCPRGFSRISYLKKHEETHRELEEAAILEVAKEKDTTNSATECVSIPGMLECSFCNLSFCKKSLLEAHRSKHYKISPTGQKLYECVECKKCFNNSSNLHKHAVIHIGLKPFACKLCDQRFRQATHLERHYMVHTKERPFKCTHCQKGFRDSSDLQKHQRVHTGEKPYYCPICMKSFKHHHNARAHRQRHLGGGITRLRLPLLSSTRTNVPSSTKQGKLEAMVKCLMCSLELHTHCQVVNHHCTLIHNAHQQAKKCSFCSKLFTTLPGLRRHYLTHPAHKVLTCQICSKNYLQLAQFERHKQTHIELIFKCLSCEKTFHNSSDLIKHQQEHIRSKIMQCELCGKTFSRMFLLSNHLLTHKSNPDGELVNLGDIIKVEVNP
ncbi:zinc finger protein 235-like isoform X1 [Pleurodeles waltl]|uniref:zinc finger protein 235-like isoform X1 n=2 Tax=Pleurodeles waltl TaxID=8319 RepID=UPI0037094C06